ncbi:MAG: hypothetical protein RR051_01190 [Clostridiales bacterium]
MKNISRSSVSGIFLIEMLFSILIFAIIATICAKIFVGSYFIAADSAKLNSAVVLAENYAECFKAQEGSLAGVSDILGGKYTMNALENGYNEKWLPVTDAQQAKYLLELTITTEYPDCLCGNVAIKDNNDQLVYQLKVTTLEGDHE